ncbi:MAG: DUF151 domain-containing protein [Candidatus Aenigmarchaeota archaeon]|nr:DUF151 domain-containing protein [Candidatus Aenigmarchaeota archaeon]
MKTMTVILITALILAAFAAGIYTGYYNHPVVAKIIDASIMASYEVSYDGLIEVNVSIQPPNVRLDSDCRRIAFDVTPDQAMSIYNGLHNAMYTRPLTLDIMKDIVNNFGIKALQVKIDRYENDIYYATITLRKGDEILVIDARPSDSIGLAAREKLPVYFKKSLFEEKAVKVC